MKRFLIVLAVGYSLLAFALFLMGQAGDKSGRSGNPPAQSAAAPLETSAPRKESGTSSSQRRNQGVVQAGEVSKAKLPASSEIKSFETYYSNGSVSSSWNFTGGLLEGSVIFYHPNGSLWMEIPFSKGQETGAEKEYDAFGRMLFSKQMIAGAPQGEVKHYYANARLWMRALLTRGVFETLPELYSENGDEASGLFSVPEASGSGPRVFRVLTETGAPKAEWGGAGPGGDSVAKTFFENGKVSSEWPLKESRPHGSVRFYYPTGSLWREIPLENGQLSGKVITYYESGSLQKDSSYKAGLREGSARIFYEDGDLWAEFVFEAGRLKGHPKAYSQGNPEALLPGASAARAA